MSGRRTVTTTCRVTSRRRSTLSKPRSRNKKTSKTRRPKTVNATLVRKKTPTPTKMTITLTICPMLLRRRKTEVPVGLFQLRRLEVTTKRKTSKLLATRSLLKTPRRSEISSVWLSCSRLSTTKRRTSSLAPVCSAKS